MYRIGQTEDKLRLSTVETRYRSPRQPGTTSPTCSRIVKNDLVWATGSFYVRGA